jgi:hypothetical protein
MIETLRWSALSGIWGFQVSFRRITINHKQRAKMSTRPTSGQSIRLSSDAGANAIFRSVYPNYLKATRTSGMQQTPCPLKPTYFRPGIWMGVNKNLHHVAALKDRDSRLNLLGESRPKQERNENRQPKPNP